MFGERPCSSDRRASDLIQTTFPWGTIDDGSDPRIRIPWRTEAAGELLPNVVSLKTLFQNTPRAWSKVNLESVARTQVIDGRPGPSRIFALEY